MMSSKRCARRVEIMGLEDLLSIMRVGEEGFASFPKNIICVFLFRLP
jgi:hypothetical protein